MKILFFGDIVGKTGRRALAAVLPRLKKELAPDFVIANGENAAHGVGITVKIAQELFDMGIDLLTSGNHIFDKTEQIDEVFSKFSGKIIRPANFEGSYAGSGFASTQVGGHTVTVANFNAQVFMENQFRGLIASPFAALDKFLQNLSESGIIIVDFHSEATSEKRAFGLYADGRVAAVIGTHTHVQTADAQILPAGTAYISDVGMCGAADSVLGVQKEKALARFLSGGKVSLEVDEGNDAEVGYAVIEIDETNGRAKLIKTYLEKFNLTPPTPL